MMRTDKIVPLVTTSELPAVKAFYLEHLGFKVVFDNGGHLCLRAPGETPLEISFMLPEGEEQHPYSGQGLTFCIEVQEVDAEHGRLQGRGLPVERPLQDNPWGDRSFAVRDPAGVSLYIYQSIAPSEEFQQYFKE